MYPSHPLPHEELNLKQQLKREPMAVDGPTTPTASFQELLLTDNFVGGGGAAAAAPAVPAQYPQDAVMHQCPDPECGRQFSRKYTLTEHMKTHTGEKPHVCPVRTCNKRFSTSGNLARHKRLHGFIQPIECPVEGCICTFPSDNKLEKHMKFHYGGPVHVCEVLGCGKTFSTTGNLNRHMKNQHPDVYNPHAGASSGTPTEGRRSRTPLKKSPTSAEDWSQSSSNGEHHDNEDDDEDDEEDEEQQQTRLERKPKWPAAFTVETEPRATTTGELNEHDEDEGEKPDMILDSLSSLLEDTEIVKSAQKSQSGLALQANGPTTTAAAAAAVASENLFDDIIRFHVEDLGGYHATTK